MGNVVSTATTLTSGTDNQAFCYDEQNRLTWASAATGSPPCGGSLTGGMLTSAQYTASYAYDTLGRLTAAPLGGYTYGDANHLDAATAVGTTYSASYDAAGDMTCRAPVNTVTCSGTPTGNVLTYDNERRLATWQNTPSNPTSTAAYWYDGEGNRVAQTLNGTTTYYVGNDEEITGSTLLKYYHIPGLPVLGTITGVTRTYLASDGLGSETVDLSYNGTVLATALYGPYGVGRYATGTMPTSRGYTGQRQDSGSGLDYYVARYYDPLLAQFTSADVVSGPNAYGYTDGNPCTFDDPSGHCPAPRPKGPFVWVRDALAAFAILVRIVIPAGPDANITEQPEEPISQVEDTGVPRVTTGQGFGSGCGDQPPGNSPSQQSATAQSQNVPFWQRSRKYLKDRFRFEAAIDPVQSATTWATHPSRLDSLGDMDLVNDLGPANLQWLYNRNLMDDWNPNFVSSPGQMAIQQDLSILNAEALNIFGQKYGELSPQEQWTVRWQSGCSGCMTNPAINPPVAPAPNGNWWDNILKYLPEDLPEIAIG